MALGRCQDGQGCGARVVVLVNFRFVLVRPESYFRNEDFCFRCGSQSSKGLVLSQPLPGLHQRILPVPGAGKLIIFSCYSLISPGHRCPMTGQMSGGGRCWAPDKGTDVLEWRLRVRVTWLGGKEEGSKGWLLDTLTQSPGSSPASLSKHSNNSNISLNAHYQWIVCAK